MNKNMSMIYATLNIKGAKTFADVPDTLKEAVRRILVDAGCGHLTTE